MYGNLEYARQKLLNTVIKWGDKAVYVIEVNGSDQNIIVVSRTLSGRQVEAPIEQYTLRGFKLGYINSDEGAFYLVRVPMRSDWRQGLRERNCFFTTGGPQSNPSRERLMRALEATYPSFTDALSKVRNEGGSVAFSPSFCLSRRGKQVRLYYKGYKKIGTILDSGLFNISDKFRYLNKLVEGAV